MAILSFVRLSKITMAGGNGEPMAATPQRQYGKAAKSIWQETFSFLGAFVFQDCCFWTFKLGQIQLI